MDSQRAGEVVSQPGVGRPAENAIDIDAFVPPLDEIDSSFSDLDFLSFYDEGEMMESLPSSSAEVSEASPIRENPGFANSPLIGDDTGPSVTAMARIDPRPFLSNKFFSFSEASLSLMTACVIEGRVPKPEEIKAVLEPSMLNRWSSVWGDRNINTAYVTAWKRIQEKISISAGAPPDTPIGNDNPFICFKNNLNQFLSHVDQWQDIVMAFHSNGDSRHLGSKETINRVKQVWSVGCKSYGIPESFIRFCVDACPVCSDHLSGGNVQRSKKHRFEYTESFELPAKEVPVKLQQLAWEHKAKLSIRQKYLRYTPFMAEVKDYTCQKAGDPGSLKRPHALKRGPYASKRCGCQFRVRVITPILNYNERDKAYVYNEEGKAEFWIYPMHINHDPEQREVGVTDDSGMGDGVQDQFQ